MLTWQNSKLSARRCFFAPYLYNQLLFQQIYQNIEMKKLFSTALFVGVALTHNLNVGFKSQRRANGQNAYDLNCEGAHGNVKYYVDGLPAGVSFDGATIVITSAAQVGSYTVRIRAVDQIGQTAERVINLQISQQAAGRGGNANGDLNSGLNGGVNGGINGANSANGGVNPRLPGDGTSVANNPVNSNRLNGIIQNYASTDFTQPDYGNNGRFPEPNLPTGPSQPNLPNPTIIDINNNQAPRTDANRNSITPDDVALRAASDRQQNAVKGITNLLRIIDQANANKNKAQGDIQTYTQAYNDAVTAQRTAQNNIIGAETRSAQIVSAINSLSNTIQDLNNKINQAIAQRDALQRQKASTLSTITDLEGQRAGLNDKLKAVDKDLANSVQKLSDQKTQCSSFNDSINAKQNQLNARQNEFAAANAARPGVVADIDKKAAIVDDLRNKLQQAEKNLADAKIRLSALDAQIASLPDRIAAIQKDLADLVGRANACADELARIQVVIDSLKGNKHPEITKQINDLDNKISNARTSVSDIDAQLAASQGPLEELKAKLAQAQQDLTFIRSQKADADAALRQAYQRGNDANNRVAFAKQNLDAVIKRFQDQAKIASDANLNLERARAEQALARQALEQFVARYSNNLPYAIVPNGNGRGSGTPFGNNPSGSALGPIRTNGNGAPGSFRVANWNNYLSSAYGAGVSPAITGSVNQLFPFNFLSTTNGNQSANTGVVNGYAGLRQNGSQDGQDGRGGCFAGRQGQSERVTAGIVVQIRGNGFDLRDKEGKIHQVNVAPCTKLNANKPDYILETGHQAVAKGYEIQGNTLAIDASQITCVQ